MMGIELLEKIGYSQDLRHLEIRSGERMKKADGFGEIGIFFLRIDQLIGINDLLVIFPFTCSSGPFIVIDLLAMCMEHELILCKNMRPCGRQNHDIP